MIRFLTSKIKGSGVPEVITLALDNPGKFVVSEDGASMHFFAPHGDSVMFIATSGADFGAMTDAERSQWLGEVLRGFSDSLLITGVREDQDG